MNVSDKLSVAFCFDEAFCPYATVAIFSLFLRSRRRLRVYCLVDGLSVEKSRLLIELAEIFGQELVVMPVDLTPVRKWNGGFLGYPPAAFSRLLIPDLIDADRVLYLDSDLIVTTDLSELFETRLEGAMLAGVNNSRALSQLMKIPVAHDEPLINSGVMLMDLVACRSERLLDRCGDVHNRFGGLTVFADQCLINKAAEGRKCVLNWKWNAMVLSHLYNDQSWAELLSKRPGILHFVSPLKPWMPWCPRPIQAFWQGYARLVSRDVPLEYFLFKGEKPIQLKYLNAIGGNF